MRIARELHDLLGHHLTGLSLDLEVASHLAQGKAQEHIQTAQSVTKLLLQDVREVVSSLRGDDSFDLGRAIRTLTKDIPKPRIHLNVPEDLGIYGPVRAETILRCVQEIITMRSGIPAPGTCGLNRSRRPREWTSAPEMMASESSKYDPATALSGCANELNRSADI